MKKLKQLCFLTLLTMLLASCSRMVSTDYDVMEHGTITAIDSLNRSFSIRSLTSKETKTWYVDNPCVGALSIYGLVYLDDLAVNDTVYVYRDGGEMLVSKYSIADVKDLNDSLCSYYWLNIAENWYWFSLIISIVALCILTANDKVAAFAILVGLALVYGMTGLFSRLRPMQEGTITEITENYVKLDSSRIIPYASLTDLKTHKRVRLGQNVTLYETEYLGGRKIFFSSQKLNPQAVEAPQTYPEVWLKSLIFYFISVIVVQIPFLYLPLGENKRKK